MYKKLTIHAQKTFAKSDTKGNLTQHAMVELRKRSEQPAQKNLDAGSLPSFLVHLGSQSAEGNRRSQYGERSNRTDDPANSYVFTALTDAVYVTTAEANVFANAGSTTTVLVAHGGFAVSSGPSSANSYVFTAL